MRQRQKPSKRAGANGVAARSGSSGWDHVWGALVGVAVVASVAGAWWIAERVQHKVQDHSSSESRILTAADGLHNVTCREDYEIVVGCSPPPFCARSVVEHFISAEEVAALRGL